MLKVPIPSGATGAAWLESVSVCLDFALSDSPSALVVSVGYDGLAVDPLASLGLTKGDYAEAVKECVRRMEGKKVVLGLEGGYDLEATAEAVKESIETLLELEKR